MPNSFRHLLTECHAELVSASLTECHAELVSASLDMRNEILKQVQDDTKVSVQDDKENKFRMTEKTSSG